MHYDLMVGTLFLLCYGLMEEKCFYNVMVGWRNFLSGVMV